jgi:putative peptidoglycan lipid II flippase
MLALPESGVVWAYAAFAIGLGLQAVILAASIWGKAKVGSSIDPLPIATPAVAMLATFAILSALPPFERVLAAGYRPPDAAYLDYTMRSLSVVQRLIVGGLAFAALGTWSGFVAERRFTELHRSITRSVTLVAAILIGAAAIAAVSAQPLIALIYQRGRFTSADSSAVAAVMIFALIGFVAEGISLVLTTALASTRHNYLLATIALGHFAARLTLDFILAPRLGALGIALAYSLVMTIVLFSVGAIVYRLGLLHPARADAVRALAVVAATAISAGVSLALGIPGLVAGTIVGLTFAFAWSVMRPVPLKALLVHEAHPVA